MAKKYKKEEVVSGVINFLKETDEEGLLPHVALELSKVSRDHLEAKVAYLYSVLGLDNEQKELIKQKLEKLSGHEIQLREKIDKSLIGGFKIKLGDWVYDASIKGQLQSFKEDLYAEN